MKPGILSCILINYYFLKDLLIEMIIWLLQRNILIQLHTFIYLMPKKCEHQRLACGDKYSKSSDLSIGIALKCTIRILLRVCFN